MPDETAAPVKCTGREGRPCGNKPIKGSTVCYNHGGNLPQVRAKAEQRLAEQKAERTLARVAASLKDVAPMESIGDVYADLFQLAGINRAWRDILQERVAKLTKFGTDTLMGEQAKIDVALFERALTRCAKLGTELARLNLEERRQLLDERLATTVVDVIYAVLDDLELTAEQKALAETSVPKRLRGAVA